MDIRTGSYNIMLMNVHLPPSIQLRSILPALCSLANNSTEASSRAKAVPSNLTSLHSERKELST